MDNTSGKIGEDYVARTLEQRGYAILERNYHSRYGEIDIIAKKEPYLIFVEVKARGSAEKGVPAAQVTKAKQKKVIQTALLYLADHPKVGHLQCRFDVAGLIVCPETKQVDDLFYLENAFGYDG